MERPFPGERGCPKRAWKSAAFGVLVSAVERVLGTGSSERAFELSLRGWSMVHGLSTLWLDGPIHGVGARLPSAKKLADRFTQICIDGAPSLRPARL